MKLKVLLLSGAVCTFCGFYSYSQQTSPMQERIHQKEQELAAATASSRQVYATTSAELMDLYEAYRVELENQLANLTDEAQRSVVEAEHKELLGKINTLSSPKRN